MIDGAGLDGLLAHKLAPLAAVRRRAAGSELPAALVEEERAASFASLSAGALLRRIRELADGPIVLLKGPELAALYPPNGRRFGDVDVLVTDAAAVHRALSQHGFVATESEVGRREHHHLVPLRWPIVPLNVEVHSKPNWPQALPAPPVEAIFEAATPSVVGIEGVSAPHPLHHALLLAAHGWTHEPLQTLRDLVDIAAVSANVADRELEQTARAWGIGRIWSTTRRTIDALFFDGPRPASLRLWGRHLEGVRERTVSERHLQAVLHPFWGLPPAAAIGAALEAIRVDLMPMPDERWREKLRRVPRAIRDAAVPVSRRARP